MEIEREWTPPQRTHITWRKVCFMIGATIIGLIGLTRSVAEIGAALGCLTVVAYGVWSTRQLLAGPTANEILTSIDPELPGRIQDYTAAFHAIEIDQPIARPTAQRINELVVVLRQANLDPRDLFVLEGSRQPLTRAIARYLLFTRYPKRRYAKWNDPDVQSIHSCITRAEEPIGWL